MPAAAIVGGSIIGGLISSDASKSAANTQAQAANNATLEQRRQFDITNTNLKPYRDTGTAALGRLNQAATGDNSNFFASPDYNFRRSEGDRGIQQSAAAQGGLFSGNALKALSEYNSNLAGGEYGNWWNRQAGLADVGQQATQATGQFGQQTANNISNNLMASGDARASGIVGSANSIAGGINSGIGNYFAYQNYQNSLQKPNNSYGFGGP